MSQRGETLADKARRKLDEEERRRANGGAAEDASGITDSDLANACRLARDHGQDLRYTPECGWMVWDEQRWAADEAAAMRRAKAAAVAILDEIKHAGPGQQSDLFKWARRCSPPSGCAPCCSSRRSELGSVPGSATSTVIRGCSPSRTAPWIFALASC